MRPKSLFSFWGAYYKHMSAVLFNLTAINYLGRTLMQIASRANAKNRYLKQFERGFKFAQSFIVGRARQKCVLVPAVV